MNRLKPDPSPRILRAAWIMACAFSPNRVVAVCAYPWAVLSILPGTIRRGLYLDDTRTGMVNRPGFSAATLRVRALG